MRKLIVLLMTLLPVAAFSQKMVNGFGLEVFIGKTYTSTEHLSFNYNNENYELNMTGQSSVIGGTAYFPFDMGVKRHRFIIAPGFEYRSARIDMGTGNSRILGTDGLYKDDIRIVSTTYTPLVQVLYRPHFYLGKLHASFSLGANFKYTVYGSLEICDKENSALATYKKDLQSTDNEYIDFGENLPAQRLRDLKFHIDPRLGLDFYIGNSLAISLFAIVPDISSMSGSKSIALEYGAGLTYLIKTNKITEAKILQQYKK